MGGGVGTARCERADIENVADRVVGSTGTFQRLGDSVTTVVLELVGSIVAGGGCTETECSVGCLAGVSADGRCGVCYQINPELLGTGIAGGSGSKGGELMTTVGRGSTENLDDIAAGQVRIYREYRGRRFGGTGSKHAHVYILAGYYEGKRWLPVGIEASLCLVGTALSVADGSLASRLIGTILAG